MNDKTLYLECGMGAAGDMLAAALLELLPEPERFVNEFNALGIPDVKMEIGKTQKCGITGTKVHMLVHGMEEQVHEHHHHGHEHTHDHGNDGHAHGEDPVHPHHDHDHAHAREHGHDNDHEHSHSHGHSHDQDHGHGHGHSHSHAGMTDIEAVVNALPLPEKVRGDILRVYGLIAEAESRAHNRPVTEIHFHEVGTMDAVADVTAVCMLMDRLAPDRVCASSVSMGRGHVHCAHGILPVPAPATAYILRDAPVQGGPVDGELCTPTGAALLKYFVTDYGDMPAMKVLNTGYGMGTKDFEIANCLRAFLGEEQTAGAGGLIQLDCNVDDMTGEQIAFAADALREAGAKEVFTVAAGMKKSRPGTVISIICPERKREEILKTLFLHTTTIGVRETAIRRHVLDRQLQREDTPFGAVTKKVSTGYGVTKEKYEYEDLAAIARREGLSIRQVLECIEAAKHGRE